MPNVAEIVDFLQSFAPLCLAAEWDNVGLILGDRAVPVQRVLTCLTVAPEIVAEAIQDRVNLIVTHHPMLFRPVQSLTDGTAEGRMVLALLRAGIAVYSLHTAFDNCSGGINDLIAQRLGLIEVTGLRRGAGQRQCKLVVFVPEPDLASVSDAIFAAGAGCIGKYSQCSFRLAGTGTFFGSDDAKPTLGQKGRREEVSEWRLEAVCPVANVDAVIAAMRKAHSYEEPAFDVVPLQPMPQGLGEGRVGRLAKAIPLREFAGNVRNLFACGPVQFVGVGDKSIQRVAVACGAGGEFLTEAVPALADVLLTGEARFHDYQTANVSGISLVLPGHFATERFGVEILAKLIGQRWHGVKTSASLAERDPVSWV